MSASILESQAAFVERAKAINMPDALVDLMIEKGLDLIRKTGVYLASRTPQRGRLKYGPSSWGHPGQGPQTCRDS